MDDLGAIKGSSWAPLPPPLRSVERYFGWFTTSPTVEPDEERPVPQNMKITQDVLKKFGYTPGCAKMQEIVAK